MYRQQSIIIWRGVRANLALTFIAATVSACGTDLGGALRPDDSNTPSPVAGTRVSREANQRAEMGMYRPVEYANVAKKGSRIIVLPGDIKSSNAIFSQSMTATNIADFGELELRRANFTVIERSNLGPLLHETELAYSMGNPSQARRIFQKGKLQTTKWVVKFDVLKAEQVTEASTAVDGGTISTLLNILTGGGKASAAGSVIADSVRTNQAAGVWVIGMRYKVIDANTTEQVATGYAEDKMELGRKSSSLIGVSTSASGQLTIDSLVQRLVQKSVAEIDATYK